MQIKDNLDDDGRVDLLCHLVVAQLVGRVMTGQWLEPALVVGSTRVWSRANGASPMWLESIQLGCLSEDVAAQLWCLKPLRVPGKIAKLFADSGRLDDGSPIVQNLRGVCEAFLLSWNIERRPPTDINDERPIR
jgi:hypothetical protein